MKMILRTIIVFGLVVSTLQGPDVNDMVFNVPGGQFSYGQLIEDIVCHIEADGVDELQIGVVWGDLAKDEVVVFAVATRNPNNRTEFILEKVVDSFTNADVSKLENGRIQLTMNVYAMFRTLDFVCRAVPTDNIPWITKQQQVDQELSGDLWAWADTSALVRGQDTNIVMLSCPSSHTKTLRIQRLTNTERPGPISGGDASDKWEMYANVTPKTQNIYDDFFPTTNGSTQEGVGYSTTLSYELDGRFQLRVIDKTRVSMVNDTRVYKFECIGADNTLFEWWMPIVPALDATGVLLEAKNSHAWQNEAFELKCSANSKDLQSIKINANGLYNGDIISVTKPFLTGSTKKTPDVATGDVSSDSSTVVLTALLRNKHQGSKSRGINFTCTATTTTGDKTSTTKVQLRPETNPQHIIKPFPSVFPITGKAVLSKEESSDKKRHGLKCTLDGQGKFESSLEILSADSNTYSAVSHFETDTKLDKHISWYIGPQKTSATYRCTANSRATSTKRVSAAIIVEFEAYTGRGVIMSQSLIFLVVVMATTMWFTNIV